MVGSTSGDALSKCEKPYLNVESAFQRLMTVQLNKECLMGVLVGAVDV